MLFGPVRLRSTIRRSGTATGFTHCCCHSSLTYWVTALTNASACASETGALVEGIAFMALASAALTCSFSTRRFSPHPSGATVSASRSRGSFTAWSTCRLVTIVASGPGLNRTAASTAAVVRRRRYTLWRSADAARTA